MLVRREVNEKVIVALLGVSKDRTSSGDSPAGHLACQASLTETERSVVVPQVISTNAIELRLAVMVLQLRTVLRVLSSQPRQAVVRADPAQLARRARDRITLSDWGRSTAGA